MIKSNLKIFWKTLLKYKTNYILNIFGLVVGITGFILIMTYLNHEYSYDKFNLNYKNIYRVSVIGKLNKTDVNQTGTPPPLASTLKKDFPEVIYSTRIQDFNNVIVQIEDKKFLEDNIFAVDSSFMRVFTFKVIKGDALKALGEPHTIVITKSAANTYFGNKDPLGESLSIFNENNVYKVGAIIDDIPENSHFKFKFLISSVTMPWFNEQIWFSNFLKTYIVLRNDVNKEEFEEKLKGVVRNYYGSQMQQFGGPSFDEWKSTGNEWKYYLQPLSLIHINSNINDEFQNNNNVVYLKNFFLVAIFLILISYINYISLIISYSFIRFKEIAVKKVLGSDKFKLLKQFLFESIIISIISLIISIILVKLLLPLFNRIIERQIEIQLFSSLNVLLSLISLSIILGVISGIIPALNLSSSKVVDVMSKKFTVRKNKTPLRFGLIIIQFILSSFIILWTIHVKKQIDLIQTTKLEFKEDVVVIINNANALEGNNTFFKEELLKLPEIKSMSYADNIPGSKFINFACRPQEFGQDEVITLNNFSCDYDYTKTLGLKIKQGRFFSKDFADLNRTIVLNSTACKILNWTNPIGKYIFFGRDFKLEVIGVIDDFNYESVRKEIQPMCVSLKTNPQKYLLVKIRTKNISSTLKMIEKEWKEKTKNLEFNYTFLDQEYKKLYKDEFMLSKLFSIFSILTVIIASLGLLSLSLFISEKRLKEIGIRKVLGSNISQIFMLLFNSLIKWIVIANIICIPISYFVINQWLKNFAYKIDFYWFGFVIVFSISMVITLLSIFYPILKAARRNPTNMLVSE